MASSSSNRLSLFNFDKLGLPSRFRAIFIDFGITEDALANMTFDEFEIFVVRPFVFLPEEMVFITNTTKALLERDSKYSLDLPPLPDRPPSLTFEELLKNYPSLKLAVESNPRNRIIINFLLKDKKITLALMTQCKDIYQFKELLPSVQMLDTKTNIELWKAIKLEKRIIATQPITESKEAIQVVSDIESLFNKYHLDKGLLNTLKEHHFSLALLSKMKLFQWHEHPILKHVPEDIQAACLLAIEKENLHIHEEKVILNTSGLEEFNSEAVEEYKCFFEKYNLRVPFQRIVSHLLTRGIHLDTLKALHFTKNFDNLFPTEVIGVADCTELSIAISNQHQIENSEGFKILRMLHRLEEPSLLNILGQSAIQPLAEYLDVPGKISSFTQREMLKDSFKNEETREKKLIKESFDPISSAEDFMQRYHLTLSEAWKTKLQSIFDREIENAMVRKDHIPKIYGMEIYDQLNLDSLEEFKNDLIRYTDLPLTNDQAAMLYASFLKERDLLQREESRIFDLKLTPDEKIKAFTDIYKQIQAKIDEEKQKAIAPSTSSKSSIFKPKEKKNESEIKSVRPDK